LVSTNIGCLANWTFRRELESMNDRRRPQSRRESSDRRIVDRRADARFASQTCIRFLRAGNDGEQILHGKLLDVSSVGIRFLFDERPQPSETVLVEARGENGHCFNLTAKVVWIESTDDDRFRVGCELRVELTEGQRRLLEEIAAK
jgi:hypothetical protein